MSVTNKSLAALLIGVSVFAFASKSFAQPDVPARPKLSGHARISEARKAALEACTSGIKFDSDTYVACMIKHHQAP
jgi:hypothetical protein